MSSRTRKILELAKCASKLREEDLPVQTYSEVTIEDSKNVVTKNIENSDFQSEFFIVNEDGTLMPVRTTVDDSSLRFDSFDHIPLDVSEAEALTAVNKLTCGETLSSLNCVDHSYHSFNPDINTSSQVTETAVKTNHTSESNPEFNGINTIVVVAEMHKEPIPNFRPKVSLVNKAVKPSQRQTHKQIQNNTENLIVIDVPHTGIDEEDIVETDRSSDDVEDQVSKRKRRKRHQVSEDDWRCKQAKILREQGKEYKGRIITDGKVTGYINRPNRTIKNITCKCKGKTFQCHKISELERQQIFDSFWALTWKERKMLIKTATDVNLTERARDRKEEIKSRRSYSYKFHLFINNMTKVRVCKKTLLATLDVGEWMVKNWIEDRKEKDDDFINEPNPNDNTINKQTKSKRISRQLDLNQRLKLLKEFLLALPNVESHYCRASSQKLYLEPNWVSKAQLVQFYVESWCKEKNCKPLSSCTFHKTFEDLNLSLYRPKKDQCDTCRAYKLNHITKEEFDIHTGKKDAAREEKTKDKINEEHVYTVDLQSLLLCPKSNASALYYRRKLSVHNLTIFDLKTKDGFCFLWNETEGELTANEFASILTHFIASQLPLRNSAKKIVIFSDGCNYQNRSAVMSNALLYVAVKHKIIIESKYLEKGHTQMECDSMHATIERYLKHREIHVPADYIDACRNARRNNPYSVTYLDHSFFKDFSKPMVHKSIRPGFKKGDPKVTDIRCLKYEDTGEMSYKLSFKDGYKLLPTCDDRKNKGDEGSRKSSRKAKDPNKSFTEHQEKTRELPEGNFQPLYKDRLKITAAKYQHLQELKPSVPRDYHSFYDDLPM